MERRRRAALLGLLVLLLGFWFWGREFGKDRPAAEHFMITAFSVGKADALLLQEGDTSILVDAGEEADGPVLLEELRDRGIGKLDLLIITHFDKDHVGGAACVLENMAVDRVLTPDYKGDRPEYQAFLEALKDLQEERLTRKESFMTGSLEWTVYPAEDPAKIQDTDGEYDNDMSLVASVTYKDRSFLLTGDIEKTRIGQMLATDEDWTHDWIKMPHHGRYQKAVKELLDAVQPAYAVICCSEEDPAEKKTLEALRQRGIQTWDTSAQTVVTVCDGDHIKIHTD